MGREKVFNTRNGLEGVLKGGSSYHNHSVYSLSPSFTQHLSQSLLTIAPLSLDIDHPNLILAHLSSSQQSIGPFHPTYIVIHPS